MTQHALALAEIYQKYRIERGPYLMVETASSIKIRWATDIPVQGQVWYGPTPTQLISTEVEPATTCTHQITLSDLLPDTRYYYALGTTTTI